jgi:hypothetical protein
VQVCNIFFKKFLKAQLFIYSDLAKFQFSASPPPSPLLRELQSAWLWLEAHSA